MENLEEIHQCSQNSSELPALPLQLSFQSEPSNHNRQSVLMSDFVVIC